MKKIFEVGKYYQPATSPSVNPFRCEKTTDFFAWFLDEETGEVFKAKKKEESAFLSGGVESWETVTIKDYVVRSIDD